jgi:ubiquinone/menaquinone biosynthesis C-methylase UbiE
LIPRSESSEARARAGQDEDSARLNAEFFAEEKYAGQVAELDTYRFTREAINAEVAGMNRLLDVGNGGVFEYDTDRVGSIVAVDLFLDRLPESRFPSNVSARRGDAMALDEPGESYDAVLHAFLYHHLVGRSPSEMVANTQHAIDEAYRVLKRGGVLIVAESCVNRWFYPLERLLFRPLTVLAKTPLLGGHPATFQLTFDRLCDQVARRFDVERAYPIETGRWISQFGRRWPKALTPARQFMVVARKR